MKKILKAITGKAYGLYDGDDIVFRFDVDPLDLETRARIDPLQMTEVDYDEDIAPLLEKPEEPAWESVEEPDEAPVEEPVVEEEPEES